MAKKLKFDSVISELKNKHDGLSQDLNLHLEGFFAL